MNKEREYNYLEQYVLKLQAEGRLSFSLEEIRKQFSSSSEIDPIEWINLFKDEGIITSLLDENGILMLFEDYQMPHGEKAYKNGFILLDTLQLKILFNIIDTDQVFSVEGDRIKSHLFSKSSIQTISNENIKEALTSLGEVAIKNITELRSKDESFKMVNYMICGHSYLRIRNYV